MKAGWQSLRFSDLGRVFNGNSISEADKKKYFAGQVEGLPYIATKDVGFDHSINYESGVRIPEGRQRDFKLAPAKTVLVCAEGGSAGRKIAHLDEPVSFGNKLFAISPSHPHSSRFVFYYCLSDAFSKQFRAEMAGLIGGVSINKFKELTIQLPAAAEQQRIVTILDETFDGIATAKANAEKNLQNARALFESHLQSVFSERGEGLKNSELGAVCVFSQGIQVDVKHQSESKKGDDQVRFLRIVDFTQGGEPPRYIDNPGAKFIVVASDIALVRYGASTGFVCRGLDGAIANNLFRVIPNDSLLTTEYLYWFLKSPLFQDEIKRKMNGAAMPAISFGMIKDINLPMSSFADQARVVSMLNELAFEVSRLESIYLRKLTALDDLKKSLLHQAFSGQL